jgi:hypothetical protein
MEQMILNAVATVALCWSVYQLRTGIAQPRRAPLLWTKRAVAHSKGPHRRIWP